MSIVSSLSPRALAAPESGIVELVNYARGREGLLPLWVGEGDLPTPDFISRAAMDALASRRDLLHLAARHSGASPGAFAIITTDISAIRLSGRAFLRHRFRHAGDPDRRAGDDLAGRRTGLPDARLAEHCRRPRDCRCALGRRSSCSSKAANGRSIIDRIEAAITPKTRGIFINTPSNPTGWTATKTGSWPISWRLPASTTSGSWPTRSTRRYYLCRRPRALFPRCDGRGRQDHLRQFLLEELVDDRLARRLDRRPAGKWARCWKTSSSIRHRASRSSCRRVPSQPLTKATISSLRISPRRPAPAISSAMRLIATNRVETLKPDGAIYAFLKIDGVTDSRKAALDIVDKTGVGLAPGTAFGPGGELFLRACFLRDPTQVGDRRRAALRLYPASSEKHWPQDASVCARGVDFVPKSPDR